ncbi:MAG: lipoyl synthase [Candidatus Omnitrophica bacterium]|nr:lipoyl synthase [Candidatus Omnitrophota bacterium]
MTKSAGMTLNQKHPTWIRARISTNEDYLGVQKILEDKNLNTVCAEAACPNKGECWTRRHVTFMILGKVCTRKCRFCNVSAGVPEAVDPGETKRIAEAVQALRSDHVVITSVTRDDLPDKGANQFIRAVEEIRSRAPNTKIELLIPDFAADTQLLKRIALTGADIIGHNIEMPAALYPEIRPEADYKTSLEVLNILNSMKNAGAPILVKSSMMLGLGETEEDILLTFKDLKEAGVDILYAGQYLAPSNRHCPVKKYYTPQEFKFFRQKATQLDFLQIEIAPMIRSSYQTPDSTS